MASVDISVEVRCNECGKSIDCTLTSSRNGFAIDIEPCDQCLQESYAKGYDEGKEPLNQ